MRHFEPLAGLAILLLSSTSLVACASVPVAAPVASVAQAPLSGIDLVQLDGSALPASSLEGKSVLFVNVASQCGFTGQYEGLQALYERFDERGLVIVGVPCNQFGGQEPGSPEEIRSFCSQNFGVSFPLLEKQAVNGAERSELYAWLVGSEAGGGRNVNWNFEKFLVGPDGAVKARFKSNVAPDDAQLVGAIEASLSSGS